MPDKLKTMYEGDNFQLYRIIKPGMDPNALDTPKKPFHLNPAAAAAAAEHLGVAGVLVSPCILSVTVCMLKALEFCQLCFVQIMLR